MSTSWRTIKQMREERRELEYHKERSEMWLKEAKSLKREWIHDASRKDGGFWFYYPPCR